MLLRPICSFFQLLQSHMGTQCTRPKFDVPIALVLKDSNFLRCFCKFLS
jgi:hypothetical protein